MQHHPGVGQGSLDGRGEGVCAQGRQQMGFGAASTGTGDRLVGALAAGIGLEIATQNGFARGGNMRCPDHEVQVGRTRHQYH